jgi:hypothetical protein
MSDAGDEALQVVAEPGRFGVSVDLRDVVFELIWLERDFEVPDIEEPGDSIEIDTTEVEFLVTSANIGGLTMTPFPAFADAFIELHDGAMPDAAPMAATIDSALLSPTVTSTHPVVVGPVRASAFPVTPPAEWFDDPAFDGPARLTITDEGQIQGHIALWGECHIGHTGQCVSVPRSGEDYALFASADKIVRCADGCEVSVGQLTLRGGHAPLSLSWREAAKFYDDTDSAVADVTPGEDRFGVWVAGALRPSVSPEDLRIMRASGLSGDWRPYNGGLELVAACFVNVQGFPKVQARIAASGEVTALIAGGAPPQTDEQRIVGVLTRRVAALEGLVASQGRRLEMVDADVRAAARDRLRAPAPTAR